MGEPPVTREDRARWRNLVGESVGVSWSVAVRLLDALDTADKRVKALRAALVAVKERKNQVCGAFQDCLPELCVDIAPKCQPWHANAASYEAFAIADEALSHDTPADEEPANG